MLYVNFYVEYVYKKDTLYIQVSIIGKVSISINSILHLDSTKDSIFLVTFHFC